MSNFARPKAMKRFLLTALHGENAVLITKGLAKTSRRGLRTISPEQPKLPKFPRYLLEQAEELRSEHCLWMAGKNIVGFGISKKKKDGCTLKDDALTVYVREKRPKAKCRRRRVPCEIEIPGMSKPILTDVVPVGDFRLQKNKHRVRPARPGFSIGHINGDTGTFGCLVERNGVLYILSSAHVIAKSGLAAAKSKIVQPGPRDDKDNNSSNDVIGELSESVAFQFAGSSLLNTCDAAIARVTGDVTSLIDQFGVPKGISDTVEVGDKVKLSGRTSGSGVTEGTVEDVNFTTKPIDYPRSPGVMEAIQFHEQVLCSRFTSGGDSGAAVLNDRNRVVGLHLGGAASISVFNPIGFVLNTFNVKVVTKLV